ncbi:MAG: type II secretion system F family protein [Lachnospiraceae bacterium]|jgi:tight adherence protein C
MESYLIMALIVCAGVLVFCLVIGFVEPLVYREMFRRTKVQDIADKDLEALQRKAREENTIARRIRHFFEEYSTRHSGHVKNIRQEQREKDFAHRLYAAGMATTPAVYRFLLSVVTFCCVLAAFLAGEITHMETENFLLCMVLGAVSPVILFRYYVSARVTMRRNQMESQLPDAMDLLAISVGAGMGFDQALTYITEKMTGPLIDEFAVLERELQLGKSRTQAFTDFGEHSNSQMIRNFSAAVVQATEMGIPLHDMLVSQAEAARSEHVAKVRAKAAKATVRMLLPMVGFIFPVLFIVLMGPAVMNILDSGIL